MKITIKSIASCLLAIVSFAAMGANAFAGTPSHLISPSPVNGSTLTSNSLSLAWSTGTGVSKNVIWIGSDDGAIDLWSRVETSSSDTFIVPTDGRVIHVRIWSLIDGQWQFLAYRYITQNTSSTITTPAADNAVLSGSSQTFVWTAANHADALYISIGNHPYSTDLAGKWETGSTTDTFNNLPTNGGPVYVTLWSHMDGGWVSNLYYYTASGGN